MQFIPREQQALRIVGYALLPLASKELQASSDAFFDGEPVGNKAVARHWIEENDVHRAPSLSDELYSTRFFLGAQTLLVRDEVRTLTHVVAPARNSLSVVAIKDGTITSREILFSGFTQRAHIALRKFDGKTFVFHTSGSPNSLRLFLNKQSIESEAAAPDFPYLAFSQEPIGHVAASAPRYGLLAYKDRESGRIYFRKIAGEEVGPERQLNCPPTVGGVDFGMSGDAVLFRINALEGGKVIPMSAHSEDAGDTISEFTRIDLGDAPFTEFVPANAAIDVDHSGNLHIPIGAIGGDTFHLLDCIPGKIVTDAVATKRAKHNYEVYGPFPSNPGNSVNGIGVGDGITDGDGIIVTVVTEGRILAANSQAGGTNYPEPAFLNYDMPRAAALKATHCYTRGARTNSVTMDYLLLESDDSGNPISQKLLIETWDMPLPQPVIEAKANGTTIHVKIAKGAFFYVGKTTFELSDPTVNIRQITFDGARDAFIECDTDKLSGVNVSFRAKNIFYDHESSTSVI